MPKNEFSFEDPLEMIGVELRVNDEESLKEMAMTFVEEFARSGFGEGEILSMFQNSFYIGPHQVWKTQGEIYVRKIVKEALKQWRPCRRES